MYRRRSRDVSPVRLPLALALLGSLAAGAGAQSIDVNSAVMFGDAFAFTQRPPAAPCLVNTVFPAGAPLAFAPGFNGSDRGNRIYSACGLTIFTCPLFADALGTVTMRGVGTQTVQIDWRMWTSTYNNCGGSQGGPYIAIGDLYPFQATMNLQVNGAGGATIPLHYDWRNLSGAYCESEAVAEDAAGITGAFLTLGGTDLFAGAGFNFNVPILANVSTATFGTDSTSTNVTDGLPFQVSVSGEPISIIASPGKGFYNEDVAGAYQRGRLILSINPIPPTICPAPALEFSVDIGSDAELSDPNLDGDEVLDPGDMYRWFGPHYAIPTNGFVDDASIFGFDHDPNPATSSRAATCSALPPTAVLTSMFDLDGSDRIDIDLTTINQFPVLRSDLPASQCIYPPDDIQISFDDDVADHYVGTNLFCGVPVTSASPILSNVFGQAANSDEVLSIMTAPGFPPLALGPIVPILDEASLHGALSPNPPDDFTDSVDDDVDALDATPDSADTLTTCHYWCFSADHEAVSQLNLDPGDIYCVDLSVAGAAPVLVVDDVTDLGLPDSTDVDAFEFAWVLNPANGAENLALLFSVDDDDPLTAPDESGGFDPGMIYVSFLDGASVPLLDTPLTEDIDAISVYCDFIQPVVQGACCLNDGTCAGPVTPDDCNNLGGQFMGNGSDCANIDCGALIGACCLPGAICTDTLEIDCAQLGGGFLGVGTSCTTDTCIPCCLPTGRCVITSSAAECASFQGTPGPAGSSCADVDCSLGACCWGCDQYPGGNPLMCQDVSRSQCCALGGLFAGQGSTCATFNCDDLCRADLDGNGSTNVFDFGTIAVNFSSAFPAISGRCDGDLNCDGVVNIFDFSIFATNFGCSGPAVPNQCCTP